MTEDDGAVERPEPMNAAEREWLADWAAQQRNVFAEVAARNWREYLEWTRQQPRQTRRSDCDGGG